MFAKTRATSCFKASNSCFSSKFTVYTPFVLLYFFFSSSFLLSVCCAFLDSVVSIRRVVLIVLVERSQEKGSQTPKKRRQKSHNRITTRFLEFISIQKCRCLSSLYKKKKYNKTKGVYTVNEERTQRTKREKERERDCGKRKLIPTKKIGFFYLYLFFLDG